MWRLPRRLIAPAGIVALVASVACGSTGPSRQVDFTGSIHMVTATTGWASAYEPRSAGVLILRTTNAGALWHDVSPPGTFASGTPAAFTDSDHAWLLDLASPGRLRVSRTADGGATWQQVAVDDAQVQAPSSFGLGYISFADLVHGWFFVGYDYNGNEDGALYRSTDGGASWALVSATDAGHGLGNGLPWQGGKEALTFVDATTGWLSAATYEPAPYLYITHDAGVTWKQVVYPLPPGVSDLGDHAVSGPQFFSPSRGIFEVLAGNSYVYRTGDGGATWTLTTSPGCCNDFFVDMQHGWSMTPEGPAAQDLYATSDGGDHWKRVASGINAQTPAEVQNHFITNVVGLDFVSPNVGFAVRESGQPVLLYAPRSPAPKFNPPSLLKTTDGGATWSDVTYIVE